MKAFGIVLENRRLKRQFITSVAAFIFSGACWAAAPAASQIRPHEIGGFISVERLLRACEAANSGGEGVGSAYCFGMVNGVSAIMRMNCMTVEDGRSPSLSLRMGEIPSYAAARQAFINWARGHPEKWGSPDFVGASLALSETFPCES